MIFEVLFWLSLGSLGYVFFGFPVALLLVASIKQRPVRKNDVIPSVSVIVCAYNEEQNIQRKIQNCLELDYPKDQMEIIVVSDGSTDKTNTILQTMRNPLLKVCCLPERSGKTECQNVALVSSKHEVLFFTDATTIHPPNSLKLLLRSLYDPSIGCVTGVPVFKMDDGLTSKGLGHREKYEMFLRYKLGEVQSVFGATDCMYAIPRRLYPQIRQDLDSGFVGPLKLLEKGHRTVYEPEALAFVDRPAPNVQSEFARRSRIVLRGMRGLLHMRHLMNPFKFGFQAIALISTRLLRWLTPVFMITLFISNVFLLATPFFLYTFLLQIVFYLAAFMAFLVERRGYSLGVALSIPLYVCTWALSATVGLKRLLAGETGQMWQPRR